MVEFASRFALGAFFITSALMIVLLLVERASIDRSSFGYAGLSISGPLLTLNLLLWIVSAAGILLTYKHGPLV